MRTRALWLFPAVGILFTSHSLQAVPVHQWSQRFGDANYQAVTSLATDGSGNVLITGQFIGTVDFGGGPLTSTTTFYPDIYVAKFNASGTHLWSHSYHVLLGDGWVAADRSDNVIIAGYFYGTVDFGGGPLTEVGNQDIFVAKFDANGTHIWSQRIGDDDFQGVASVAADGSGNVVITGRWGGSGPPLFTSPYIFVKKLDADGNELWSGGAGGGSGNEHDANGTSVVDGSGNVIVTGVVQGLGYFYCLVVKSDASGNFNWYRSFGDPDNQVFGSVAADRSNNIVFTGNFTGTVDFGGGPLTSSGFDLFMVKFDASGNHLRSQQFAGSLGAGPAAADGSGNVFITGGFSDTVDFGGGPLTSAGGGDVFVAMFDGDGDHVWSERYGDADNQSASSVATYGSSNIVVTGVLNGTVDFGGGPLTSEGGGDIFLARFSGDPTSVTAPRFDATLGQNFPNPFNPATTIEYTLSEQTSAVLGIYDATGRLIVRLDQGMRDAGTHRAEWDGRDADGRAVGSGVYFYRLEGAPSIAAKKMVLVR
jgi:hypothetical protein